MVRYQLYNYEGEPVDIQIDESAKQDFKKMMNWNEIEWGYHTEVIEKGSLQEDK